MDKYAIKRYQERNLHYFGILLIILLFFIANISCAQLRIITYHCQSSFGFSETEFTMHMNFLKDNDYHTITLDQAVDWVKDSHPLPIRPIVITADDDYIMVYDTYYPILKNLGFTGVNFAHTSYAGVVTGNGDHCDWNEINIMETDKVVFTESHSRTHPNLPLLTPSQKTDEIAGSKSDIESHVEKTCNYIAYPYGNCDEETIQIVESAGYRAAFKYGNNVPNYHSTPIYELERIAVDNADSDSFKNLIGFTELPPDPPGEGWTIDNTDVNFYFDSTKWPRSTSVQEFYGTDYRYHSPGTGSNFAKWACYLPESGIYNVYAWWTTDPNRASNTPYLIKHSDGEKIVRVSQKINGGKWNRLGIFRFSENIPAEVIISDDANGYVIADGIWFEPVYPDMNIWMLN